MIKFRTLENCNPTEILLNVIERAKMDVFSLKKSLLKNVSNNDNIHNIENISNDKEKENIEISEKMNFLST